MRRGGGNKKMIPMPAIILNDVETQNSQLEFALRILQKEVNRTLPECFHVSVEYESDIGAWTILGASGGDIIEIRPAGHTCFSIKYMVSGEELIYCYGSSGIYNMLFWAVTKFVYSH
jgi:hypothetical protein